MNDNDDGRTHNVFSYVPGRREESTRPDVNLVQNEMATPAKGANTSIGKHPRDDLQLPS